MVLMVDEDWTETLQAISLSVYLSKLFWTFANNISVLLL